MQPLSVLLEKAQLRIYGRLARLPFDHELRRLAFTEGGVDPVPVGRRRPGRPRLRWVEVVAFAALQVAGSPAALSFLLSSGASAARAWDHAVAKRGAAMPA